MATTVDVLAVLNRPSVLKEQLDELEEKSRALWETATKTTPTLSDMPRGGGSDKESRLVAYIESHADAVPYREQYNAALEMATDLIDSCNLTTDQRTVLMDRYLKSLDWRSVLRNVNQFRGHPVTDRTLYRWHTAALEAVVEQYDIWYDTLTNAQKVDVEKTIWDSGRIL